MFVFICPKFGFQKKKIRDNCGQINSAKTKLLFKTKFQKNLRRSLYLSYSIFYQIAQQTCRVIHILLKKIAKCDIKIHLTEIDE